MNQWGWSGCYAHREEIIEWFTDKAAEQGIDVDEKTLWSLIKAGPFDLLKKKLRR